jgi:hypothetical protein
VKRPAPAEATARPRDPNAPAIGTTLRRSFKGQDIAVKVTAEGFQYDGQTFTSISACARHICGYMVSGPVFFKTGRAEARGQGGQVMSGPSIAAQVVALSQLNVAELRVRWREVFGEDTKQRHRQFLIRRIAWELQRRESGEELSPEALKRLDELQDEFRNSPPGTWFKGAKHNRSPIKTSAVRHRPVRDTRSPDSGNSSHPRLQRPADRGHGQGRARVRVARHCLHVTVGRGQGRDRQPLLGDRVLWAQQEERRSMSDVQFYETRVGRQYFEVTMPELVRQLHRLNDLLALAVEIADRKAREEPDVRARKD